MLKKRSFRQHPEHIMYHVIEVLYEPAHLSCVHRSATQAHMAFLGLMLTGYCRLHNV